MTTDRIETAAQLNALQLRLAAILDALPVGSVVLTGIPPRAWVKESLAHIDAEGDKWGDRWIAPGMFARTGADLLRSPGPVTVLHRPDRPTTPVGEAERLHAREVDAMCAWKVAAERAQTVEAERDTARAALSALRAAYRDLATHRTAHANYGQCPEGPDDTSRDPDCPVCAPLIDGTTTAPTERAAS
jgi:hypothetical protein